MCNGTKVLKESRRLCGAQNSPHPTWCVHDVHLEKFLLNHDEHFGTTARGTAVAFDRGREILSVHSLTLELLIVSAGNCFGSEGMDTFHPSGSSSVKSIRGARCGRACLVHPDTSPGPDLFILITINFSE